MENKNMKLANEKHNNYCFFSEESLKKGFEGLKYISKLIENKEIEWEIPESSHNMFKQ